MFEINESAIVRYLADPRGRSYEGPLFTEDEFGSFDQSHFVLKGSLLAQFPFAPGPGVEPRGVMFLEASVAMVTELPDPLRAPDGSLFYCLLISFDGSANLADVAASGEKSHVLGSPQPQVTRDWARALQAQLGRLRALHGGEEGSGEGNSGRRQGGDEVAQGKATTITVTAPEAQAQAQAQVQTPSGSPPMLRAASPSAAGASPPRAAPEGSLLSNEMFVASKKLGLSLTCTHLHVENENAKNTEYQLIVTKFNPDKGSWDPFYQTEVTKATEVSPKNIGVNYLVTLELDDSEETESGKFKFALYAVEDFSNGKFTPCGSATLTTNQIRNFSGSSSLKADDGKPLAQIKITTVPSAPSECFTTMPPPRFCPLTSLEFGRETQTYLVKINPAKILNVREVILESPYAFSVPHQFFRMLEREEKQMLKFFAPLDISAYPNMDAAKKQHIGFHHQMLSFLQSTALSLQNYKGRSFRPSVLKKEEFVQPIAINCHTHIMIVNTLDPTDSAVEPQNQVYGIVTFGAAACHKEGFKKGGTKSMIEAHLSSAEPEGRKRRPSSAKRSLLAAISGGALGNVSEPLKSSSTDGALFADPNFVSDAPISYRPPLDEYLELLKLRKTFEELTTEVRHLGDRVGIPVSGKPQVVQLAPEALDALKQLVAVVSERLLPSYDRIAQTVSKNISEEKAKTLEEFLGMITKSRLPAMFSALDQINKALSRSGGGASGIDTAVVQSLYAAEGHFTKDTTYILTFSLESHLEKVLLGQHSLCDVALRSRLDLNMSQALTALVTVFALSLNTLIHPETSLDTRNFFCEQLETFGYLAQFECLLSTKGDEIGMIEDFVIAVDGLKRVSFRLEAADPARTSSASASSQATTSPNPVSPQPGGSSAPGSNPPGMPQVTLEGGRDSMTVVLYLNPQRFQLLSTNLRNGAPIAVVPVMFSQGINEQQTISNTLGQSAFQDNINEHYLEVLNVYLMQYMTLLFKVNGTTAAEPETLALKDAFLELRPALNAKKGKKVDILTIAGKLARKMNGGRLTSCKSAKDRTSMSATLEYATILHEKHHLADSKDILRVMRTQGVRRENAFKNTQKRKYAFNALQVLSLPKEYRPPKGTGGGNVT